jgi:hypothetical protein
MFKPSMFKLKFVNDAPEIWKKYGLDSSNFARIFMEYCNEMTWIWHILWFAEFPWFSKFLEEPLHAPLLSRTPTWYTS